MDDPTTTQKVVPVTKQNELEFYEKEFHKAGMAMLSCPSRDNIEAYSKAEAQLTEVQGLYREGYRVLLALQVEKRINSQKLHLL